MVAKALKRGEAAVRDYGRLLKRKVGRLGCEPVLSSTYVLRERALASPIHLVALLEPRHFLADRLDTPGHVRARHTNPGCAQPETSDAHHVGHSGHEMPGAPIDAGR